MNHKITAEDSSLSDQEYEALRPWVVLAEDLGLPRSIGLLYGLVFLSERPVSAQQCAEKLKLSRSSAGQGLKTLKEFGAIQSSHHLGERSEHFVIEPDLGVLLTHVLNGRILPSFAKFFSQVCELSFDGNGADFKRDRVEKLQRWEKKLGDSMAKLRENLS
jgi:DNA-binding transcriptional regulator GbsR (MarR family)